MSDTTAPRLIAIDANGQVTTAGSEAHVITRDAVNGLDYTLAGERGEELNHTDAIAACEAVDIAGGGWRAPTRAELLAIVDLTRHDPAVDTTSFPFIDSDWYWTTDATAWSASAAWCVGFNGGDFATSHRDSSNGLALAVRRAGQ